MSIVVAVKKNNSIVVASDTQTNFNNIIVPTDNCLAPKIRKIGNSYIASTGWSVYDNIFDDYLYNLKKKPSFLSKTAIYRFFLQLWKALHDKYGFVNDQCDEEDSPFGNLDASFLVVNKNGIFYVAPDMSVTEFEKYYATGSGNDFALGALYSLYESNLDADVLAKKACETAIAFKPYCGGEVEIIKIK